jgi:hypothetical protein
MSRAAIFIDGGYLEKLLINQFGGARVSFAKVSAHLAKSRDILRTYYYHCKPYQSPKPTPDESKQYGHSYVKKLFSQNLDFFLRAQDPKFDRYD